MKTKRIIPCLDLKDGRVVKGVNFINLVDAGDPVEIAKAYEEAGADELVLLDITASHEKRPAMLDVVNKIVENITIPVIVGGGISTLEDGQNLLNQGVNKISISSAAVVDPDFINACAKKFGTDKLVIGIDAKYNKDKEVFEVFVQGGRKNTGLNAVDWAVDMEKRGAGEILLTSMDGDGTKDGYDIALTKAVAQAVTIPVIASGGAGSQQDFLQVFKEGYADAALAASLFHFKELEIMKLKQYLSDNNVKVNIKE